jgi:hypothetical protein
MVEDCKVLDGIMINKDVTHPKMRRRIENPRIVLLDCPLEYKKGESQTNVEVTDESHWTRLLEIEEEQVKALCDEIIRVKPDLVFTEKGVSGMFISDCVFLSCLIVISNIHCRYCSTLLDEGQHHSNQTCQKDGQLPYRSCYWRSNRKSS